MAKRNNDILNMNEALQEFVAANKLEKGLDTINVKNAWVVVMGNGVNKYTHSVSLQNTTLYVRLNSSVLREELSYGKDKIIKLLNEHLGKSCIEKVVLC